MLYEDRWMGTPRDAVIFDGINVNWWPEGVNDCDDISCLVEAFAQIGYSFCETSENEPGFLKIALYYNPNNNQWTHAARESRDGTYWMSKLGRSNDIHHENPYTLEGNAYGKVYCIMKKPK